MKNQLAKVFMMLTVFVLTAATAFAQTDVCLNNSTNLDGNVIVRTTCGDIPVNVPAGTSMNITLPPGCDIICVIWSLPAFPGCGSSSCIPPGGIDSTTCPGWLIQADLNQVGPNKFVSNMWG